MNRRTYTDVQLQNAVKSSISYGSVLKKLNLKAGGGTYTHVKKIVSELNLDTSHFLGRGWSRGKTNLYCSPRIPMIDILSNKIPCPSSHLRKRLFKEGVKERKCERCNRTKWLTDLIPLELDHINGIRDDNNLSNLRILCPNCHALTSTYCGKNIGRVSELVYEADSKSAGRNVDESSILSVSTCVDCMKPNSLMALRCRVCSGRLRASPKIKWPDIQTLTGMVSDSSYRAVGRHLGVSDNAVRKRIRKYGTLAR